MSNLIGFGTSNLNNLSKVAHIITGAFNKGREYRTRVFLRTVDTRYEQMSEEERVTFKQSVESENGQKITSDFAIAVTMTPSPIVNAALALLYAKDPEFSFTESQIERFVAAVSGLTDRKVKFYLNILELIPSNPDKLPYSIYTINRDNHHLVSSFADKDEVFIYIYDFLSRGLVITTENDSQSGGGFAFSGEDIKWQSAFCLSDTHKRYGALLRKANGLMR